MSGRAWLLLAVGMLAGMSCTRRPKVEVAPPLPLRAVTGPTVMARVEGGYELRNRWQRAVIDHTTGDVTFWGPVHGGRNLLLRPGIVLKIDGSSEIVQEGYVEKRDDATWQYVGQDADGVGWRKIYCMEEESLYVTCIVQNLRKEPRTVRVALRPNFANMRLTYSSPELLAGENAFGAVMMQAFNVVRATSTTQPASCLLSDEHSLKPGERISFTTEWRLSRGGG